MNNQDFLVSAHCPTCDTSDFMRISKDKGFAYHCKKCGGNWHTADIRYSDTSITRKEKPIGPAHLIYATKEDASGWIKNNETQMSLIASKSGAISYGAFPLSNTVFLLFGNTGDISPENDGTEAYIVNDAIIQEGAKFFKII